MDDKITVHEIWSQDLLTDYKQALDSLTEISA